VQSLTNDDIGSKLPGSKSASTLDWPLNRPEHGTDTLATKKSKSNALCFSCGDISKTPPLPVSVNNLKERITTAVASADEDMLRCVWNKVD
jgi:hypothetical protein